MGTEEELGLQVGLQSRGALPAKSERKIFEDAIEAAYDVNINYKNLSKGRLWDGKNGNVDIDEFISFIAFNFGKQWFAGKFENFSIIVFLYYH